MAYIVRNGRNYHGQALESFDELMNRVFGNPATWERRGPAADVRELDDRYELTLEVPGMTHEDVQVKLEENLLTIASAQGARLEFRRSFSLPRDVDRSAVAAAVTSGLLTLTLPKVPEAQPRDIPVSSVA